MSEGSGKELRAPSDWGQLEGLDWKWDNIRMQEIVWSELPEGAAEAIEDFIRVDKCSGGEIERVRRLDPQTIEVVWYDDEGQNEEDPSPTLIADRYVRNVRTVIQELFGEHWRVKRKQDDRRYNGEHPQRVIIRRAEAQRFRYIDESDEEYLLNLHGRPDGAPEDADYYRDLDRYPVPPHNIRKKRALDVYCYETGTGTIHLLRRFRDDVIARDQTCECGLEVQAEEIVDGERVEHYAEYLRRGAAEYDGDVPFHSFDLDPKSVIGDFGSGDLCGRCWKSYARTRRYPSGRVKGYVAPRAGYEDLLRWDPEVDYE